MLNFLLPARCPICDCYMDHDGFCTLCRGGIVTLDVHCETCGAQMSEVEAHPTCAKCRMKAPVVDRLFTPWLFTGVLQTLIIDVKSHKNPQPLRPICAEFGEWLSSQQVPAASWTAVPMHDADLRARGFSVPVTCVTMLGRRCHHVLRKSKKTLKQATLGRIERAHNLVGAFQCRPVTGTWVLFDDITTTGATLDAAAAELKRAGAERVVAVTLAKTPLS